MSEGLNKVMLIGHLAADPELRQTQGGAVLKIRLATNESYLDKDKVRRERTDYHNVTVWGRRGEALANILTKGTQIYVEGSMRTSSYDDKDGKKVYRIDVVANNVILTGGRGGGRGEPRDDSGDGQSEQRAAQRDTGKRSHRNNPPPDDDASGGYGGDDDIPF